MHYLDANWLAKNSVSHGLTSWNTLGIWFLPYSNLIHLNELTTKSKTKKIQNPPLGFNYNTIYGTLILLLPSETWFFGNLIQNSENIRIQHILRVFLMFENLSLYISPFFAIKRQMSLSNWVQTPNGFVGWLDFQRIFRFLIWQVELKLW